jgi:ribose transport system permease protein
LSQPSSHPETGPNSTDAPLPPAARPSDNSAGLMARLLRSREISVVLVLVLLCVLMMFTDARSTFYSNRNIHNILQQVALLSIFAIGETLVIITGGIDLSLGSMIAFTGMLMAFFVTKFSVSLVAGVAITLGLSLTLVVAFAIGGVHATLVHRLRLPPFVVTLASLLILRSQSLLMNKQLPISIADYPAVLYLANGNLFPNSFFPIPFPVAILAVVAILTSIALNRLRIGRYLYSMGSNEQATRLSGVNVYRVKLFAYGASALLGGLAGILWAAYGSQGDPQAGNAYELDAVAAAVVGGANLAGGQGSVAGTILGAVLLHVIFSAINLKLSSPDLWRGTVVGGVLLFAVLVTALQQRRVD